MSGKRSIFEDVSEDGRSRPQAQPGLIDRGRGGARRGVRLWLMLIFVMLVALIALGGLTRLTDSGLSITEWRPVTGALPPMSQADWQAEFDRYRQIDQWRLENQWMTLADFKQIYWWEWSHRQLGRAIGLVWALGYIGFLVARRIPAGWTGRLLVPGALGGLQGAVGWWMVSSGVVSGTEVTSVASYRLALHLGLAFTILGVIAWFVFLLGREERDLMQARRMRERRLFSVGTGWMHLAFLQILLGALVAGIDAGRTYTDWPWMAGQFLPPDPFEITPVWRNFFETASLVQFMHRMVGYGLLAYGVFAWTRGRRSAHAATRFAFSAAFAALLVQVALGITTVLYAAQLHVAITHQLVAVLTWVLILRSRFMAAYPVAGSIRDVAR